MQREAGAFDFEWFTGNSRKDASREGGGFFAFAKTGGDEEFFAAPADEHVGITNGGTDA